MAVSADILAKKYAQAFLSLLTEGKQTSSLDQFAQELDALGVLGHGEIQDFFQNPLFTMEEKAKVLSHALEQVNASPLTHQFLLAVNQAGHAELIHDIAQEFGKALLAQNKTVRVLVTSAKELDDSVQKALTQSFTKQLGQDILLETQVDPSLLGGLRATVGGVVFDSTITGYLDRLGKQFSTNNVR
jgi:F-type H+-transporting ATPase subunit delta